jgi:hypothetical protein
MLSNAGGVREAYKRKGEEYQLFWPSQRSGEPSPRQAEPSGSREGVYASCIALPACLPLNRVHPRA